MNTYFILIGVIEYEFSNVIGIYDSLSALKNGIDAFKKKSKLDFDYFEYVETYMGLTDLEGCEHIIIR